MDGCRLLVAGSPDGDSPVGEEDVADTHRLHQLDRYQSLVPTSIFAAGIVAVELDNPDRNSCIGAYDAAIVIERA